MPACRVPATSDCGIPTGPFPWWRSGRTASTWRTQRGVSNATRPYSISLSAHAGAAPYTFAVTDGALPLGLTLSADGVLSPAGLLRGTPTHPGFFLVNITAIDTLGARADRVYSFSIAPLSITPVTLAEPIVELAYSEHLAVGAAVAACRSASALSVSNCLRIMTKSPHANNVRRTRCQHPEAPASSFTTSRQPCAPVGRTA
jgi:hypothetical protein